MSSQVWVFKLLFLTLSFQTGGLCRPAPVPGCGMIRVRYKVLFSISVTSLGVGYLIGSQLFSDTYFTFSQSVGLLTAGFPFRSLIFLHSKFQE